MQAGVYGHDYVNGPGAAPGALPLAMPARDAGIDIAAVPLPTRRLVAVEDSDEAVQRAVTRHARHGWTLVDPDAPTRANAGRYFGMRMLAFRRA